MTTTVIDFNKPESAADVGADIATSALALTTHMRGFAVTDRNSLEQAVRDRQELGEFIKRVQTFFRPLKQMADKLHKAICDRETAILAPLLRQDLQHREQITAFKRAEDVARERRERELAEVERQREQDRATAAAAQLEHAGETSLAAAVIEQAIAAPVPVVVLPDVTKGVEGLKFRRRWLWRLQTAALVPDEFWCLDEPKISAYVRAMGASGQIPGIEIYRVEDPVR
jgi:hypothetical protein